MSFRSLLFSVVDQNHIANFKKYAFRVSRMPRINIPIRYIKDRSARLRGIYPANSVVVPQSVVLRSIVLG